MPSNITVKISADIVDLQAKYAVAKAESSALSSELSKLARTANTSGMTDQLQGQLLQTSEKLLAAKRRTGELGDELKSRLSSSVSIVSSSFSALSGVVGQLGLALGAAQVLSFADAAFTAAAGVDHMAAVAGVGVEALQAYRAAVVESGGSEEDADMLIRRMTRSIGQAEEATGPARKAFVELGLSLNDLKSGTEDVLPLVARGLLGIQDASERARLEFALFSRSGQEIEPALRTLATPTQDLIDKMKALGLVMDPELTKASHEAQIRLGEDWKRIQNDVVPAATAVAGAIAYVMDAVANPRDKPLFFRDEASALAQSRKNYEDYLSGVTSARKKADAAQSEGGTKGSKPQQWNTPDLDAYIAKLEVSANLAGESARQRTIDSALIEAATDKLKDQGAAESKIVTTVAQARDILGAQARVVETDSAKAFDGSARAANEAAKKQIEAAREAAREESEIALSNLQTDTELARIGLLEKKALLQQEVEAGKIARVQELQQLKDLETASTNEQIVEILSLMTNLDTGAVAFNEYVNKIKILRAQLAAFTAETNAQIAASDIKTADQSAKSWDGANREILSTENEFARDVVTRRMNMGRMLLQLGSNLLTQELAADLQYWTERGLLELEGRELSEAKEKGGLLVHLGVEQAKTGATITAESARLAAKTAGQTQGAALESAIGGRQILADAAKAFSGTYAALAGIPIVGPIIAPIAASGAFAAVAAYSSIASFDVGTNYVPYDMMAMVHSGERIIPAADNRALMSAVSSSTTNNRGGDTYNLTHAPTIHAHGAGLDEIRDSQDEFSELLYQMARGGKLSKFKAHMAG